MRGSLSASGCANEVAKQLPVQVVGAAQLVGLDALRRLGAEQVQPQFNRAVDIGLGSGGPGDIQQLAAEAAQFRISFLHPVDLSQRLRQQLCVVPLPRFQCQAQRLGQIAFLGQDGVGA